MNTLIALLPTVQAYVLGGATGLLLAIVVQGRVA